MLNTLIFAVLLVLSSAPSVMADIPWLHDVPTAEEEARRSGKPIIFDFYTDWCGWSKRLDSDVYPNPSVQQAFSQYIPVKLNAEHEGRLMARQFKVYGYPTLLICDSSLHEVYRSYYESAPELVNTLNTYAGGKFPDSSTPLGFAAPGSNIGAGQSTPRGYEPPLAPGAYYGSAISSSQKLKIGLMSSTLLDPYARLSLEQGTNLIHSLVSQGQMKQAGDVAHAMTKNGYGPDLGLIYNSIGDIENGARHLDAAWGWYSLTTEWSKDTPCLSHAYLALADYYQLVGNTDKTRSNLDLLLNLPDISSDLKSKASTMLAKIKGGQ